jgi:hypothetical protein
MCSFLWDHRIGLVEALTTDTRHPLTATSTLIFARQCHVRAIKHASRCGKTALQGWKNHD